MGGGTEISEPARNPLIGALTMLTQPPWSAGTVALMVVGTAFIAVHNLWSTVGPLHPDGTACCGDFTAFWTGGYFVYHGLPLYDLAAQEAYQASIVGPQDDGWQAYPYPPTLALWVALFVPLGYPSAFVGFGAIGTLGLAVGSWRLWPWLSRLDSVARATGLGMLWSYLPVAATLLGGQTSGMALALFLLHYVAVRSRSPWAGVWLGLLLFKPQYVLLPGLWHLVRREQAILGVAAATAIVQWACAAAVIGPEWPLAFLAAVRDMARAGVWQVDAPFFLSLPAACGVSLGALGKPVGWAIAASLVAIWLWRSWRLSEDDARFPLAYAAMVTLAVVAAPHAMYYDNALIAFPALLWAAQRSQAWGLAERLGLAALWLGYPLYAAAPWLGFQPLTLEMLAAATYLIWRLRPTGLPTPPSLPA